MLLTFASSLSFIDRQILNVMIGPIKRDLGGLSDTEISLIIGLAFSLIYTLATVPLARWADHHNRRNLIAAGIFSWSLMTAVAGTANTYWQLFVARMGVGIGEATFDHAVEGELAQDLVVGAVVGLLLEKLADLFFGVDFDSGLAGANARPPQSTLLGP